MAKRSGSVRCDDGRASPWRARFFESAERSQKVAPPEKLKICVWSYLPFEIGKAKSKRIGPIGEAQIRLAPTEVRIRFGSQTFAQLGWVMSSAFKARAIGVAEETREVRLSLIADQVAGVGEQRAFEADLLGRPKIGKSTSADAP